MYHRISIVCVICLVLLSSCRAKKNSISATPTNKISQSNTNRGQQTIAEKQATPPVAKKSYTNVVEDYIDQFSDIAMQEMKQYGIPASITLAQGILESGAGQGTLSKEQTIILVSSATALGREIIFITMMTRIKSVLESM